MNTYQITARPTNAKFDAAMKALETLNGVTALPMGQKYEMERGKVVFRFETSATRQAIFAALRGVEITVSRADNGNQIFEPKPAEKQVELAIAQAARLGLEFSPVSFS